jgi:hypothetical protein
MHETRQIQVQLILYAFSQELMNPDEYTWCHSQLTWIEFDSDVS